MYKVANILIKVKNIYQSLNSERLSLFEVDSNEIADKIFEIHKVLDIEPPVGGSISYANNQFIISRNNGINTYYYHSNGEIYAKVEERTNGIDDIYIVEKLTNGEVHPYLFPSLLRLEKHLIEKDSAILHSSYIIRNGQAILFSAPSGGGKSTQAELWKKYKNAVIANGDKSIIAKEDDGWYTHGIPFSGSSDYCLNNKAPLSAVILLEKSPVNSIQRVDLAGFNRVYSQLTVNPWDREFCNKLMDFAIELCSNVPIYIYSCTKEEAAVDFLEDYLIKEGVLDGVF